MDELTPRLKRYLLKAFELAPLKGDTFYVEDVAKALKMSAAESFELATLLKAYEPQLVVGKYNVGISSSDYTTPIPEKGGIPFEISNVGRERARQLKEDKRHELQQKVLKASVVTILAAWNLANTLLTVFNPAIDRRLQRLEQQQSPTTQPFRP